MAEKSTKSTAKKSSTKPKSTGKRLSVTIDPDTMAQLNEYLAQFGYSKDEFVKKAILEKIKTAYPFYFHIMYIPGTALPYDTDKPAAQC